jgi:hypothetical protein
MVFRKRGDNVRAGEATSLCTITEACVGSPAGNTGQRRTICPLNASE